MRIGRGSMWSILSIIIEIHSHTLCMYLGEVEMWDQRADQEGEELPITLMKYGTRRAGRPKTKSQRLQRQTSYSSEQIITILLPGQIQLLFMSHLPKLYSDSITMH